jgi:hypothetical protein
MLASSMEASSDDRLTARKLTYDRIITERDRLRGARQFFARQLGPLPAAAGISLAVVAAFSERIKDSDWLWVALGLFTAMVAVSILYSRMPAYRHLRARRLDNPKMEEGRGTDSPAVWYDRETELEESVYAGGQRGCFWRWPRRNLDGDLPEQLDKERFGVFLVQILFLLVIASLLLAR